MQVAGHPKLHAIPSRAVSHAWDAGFILARIDEIKRVFVALLHATAEYTTAPVS